MRKDRVLTPATPWQPLITPQRELALNGACSLSSHSQSQCWNTRVSTPDTPLQPLIIPQRELALHKVLTYIEHRAVSGVFLTFDPPPPVHPASVSSPRTKGGGVHTRRAVRGWGVNISEDAGHWIGLSKYLYVALDSACSWYGFVVPVVKHRG